MRLFHLPTSAALKVTDPQTAAAMGKAIGGQLMQMTFILHLN